MKKSKLFKNRNMFGKFRSVSVNFTKFRKVAFREISEHFGKNYQQNSDFFNSLSHLKSIINEKSNLFKTNLKICNFFATNFTSMQTMIGTRSGILSSQLIYIMYAAMPSQCMPFLLPKRIFTI